jgi:Trypsin-co-occurring domain 2
MTTDVTVAAALKQLRAQLEEAQHEGHDKPLRFVARSIEVELSIVFKSEQEGGAGIKAWFLEVSGKAKSADETSHKVKLILELVGPDGKPTRVSDRNLERSDTEGK